jgi:SpoVK/Ycf46/Vps4 family AAA+-type ATPase
MDGIEELSNVIVVGATNRPDVLVSPLLLLDKADIRIPPSCAQDDWIGSYM